VTRLPCADCPKLVRCGDCPQVTVDEALRDEALIAGTHPSCAMQDMAVEDADHPIDIRVHDDGDPED